MLKLIRIMCLIIPIFSYADDQYIFEQPLSVTDTQSIFDNQVSINKLFHNIDAVIIRLNTLGIIAKVKNYNQPDKQNILINSDGTINDFINAAANKFGYSIVESGTQVIFVALNPIQENPQFSKLSLSMPVSKSAIMQQLWLLAPKDKTLRNSITKWCNTAGWQLVWNVKANYPIDTSWSISGSFESAINEVLKATQNTEMPLMAIMHDSNRVLEIYSPLTSKQ